MASHARTRLVSALLLLLVPSPPAPAAEGPADLLGELRAELLRASGGDLSLEGTLTTFGPDGTQTHAVSAEDILRKAEAWMPSSVGRDATAGGVAVGLGVHQPAVHAALGWRACPSTHALAVVLAFDTRFVKHASASFPVVSSGSLCGWGPVRQWTVQVDLEGYTSPGGPCAVALVLLSEGAAPGPGTTCGWTRLCFQGEGVFQVWGFFGLQVMFINGADSTFSVDAPVLAMPAGYIRDAACSDVWF